MTLTRREWEVAELVADGLTDVAIASRLAISPATVRRHLDNMGEKLGHDPERKRRVVIAQFINRWAAV